MHLFSKRTRKVSQLARFIDYSTILFSDVMASNSCSYIQCLCAMWSFFR